MGIKGINSVTLAEKVKVSKPTISYWLTGTSLPAVNKLQSIADALGIEVWQLFKDPTEEEKEDKSVCLDGKCPHCGHSLNIRID